MFSGRKKRDRLTTVILQRDDDGWSRNWVLDQSHHHLPDGHSESLELALDEVEETYRDYVASQDMGDGSCLQYAIYPWGNGGEQIYDIEGHPGLYVATDMRGSARRVSAPTIDALIAAIEETPGTTFDHAMLRWERTGPLVP
jgi:hypothetical protein